MTHTYTSPSSFSPRHSLLGRAVQAWVDDRLRREALFIVLLTGLALLLILTHYLGWALLNPVLTAHPSWQALFWGGQVASVLLLAGIGLVGICPGVEVQCSETHVELRQGDRACTLPYTSIDTVEIISARRYHRHYRRYAATRIFLSALPPDVLLLRGDGAPVVVGFDDPDTQTRLHDHLQHATAPSPEATVPPSPPAP